MSWQNKGGRRRLNLRFGYLKNRGASHDPPLRFAKGASRRSG